MSETAPWPLQERLARAQASADADGDGSLRATMLAEKQAQQRQWILSMLGDSKAWLLEALGDVLPGLLPDTGSVADHASSHGPSPPAAACSFSCAAAAAKEGPSFAPVSTSSSRA